jgi:hypothetical protein
MKQTFVCSPGGAGRQLPGKLPHADLAELPLPVGRFCGVFKLGGYFGKPGTMSTC